MPRRDELRHAHECRLSGALSPRRAKRSVTIVVYYLRYLPYL